MNRTTDLGTGVTVTKVASGVDRLAGVLSTVSTAMATIAVFWLIGSTVVHVVLRATGGSGLAGIVEVNALVVVGVVFFGLAGAQRAGAHVAVLFLVSRLPVRARGVLSAVGTALSAVVVAWMLWSAADALEAARSTGERLPGVAPVPLWPAKAVVVVGLAFLLLELVNTMLRPLAGTRREEAAEPVAQTSTEG